MIIFVWLRGFSNESTLKEWLTVVKSPIFGALEVLSLQQFQGDFRFIVRKVAFSGRGVRLVSIGSNLFEK